LLADELGGTSPGGELLLLFDIDGTLLAGAAEAHRIALHRALREIHGIDAETLGKLISPAGRTDGEIARVLLLEAGISARQIDERAEDVREACCAGYARLCPPDLSDKLVPGIRDLLGWLAGQPAVRLSLVTGNYEPVARIKLRSAGIGHHFPTGQGGFGSDSEHRVDLPPVARRRAGSTGLPFPRQQTIVIGDTPRDIACAHADDLRCIAVTTGPFGAQELGDADAVAADIPALRTLLQAVLVEGSPWPHPPAI
jgi:phosphoglycolate phosphatase